MLAISTAAAIIWFMLENFFFEPYCRFTLSVYPVLVFAMSGLYARNWEPTHGHTIPIFSACLLVISAVALVARTAVFTYKYVQRSRHQWKFAQLSSLVLNYIALEWPHVPSFLCFFSLCNEAEQQWTYWCLCLPKLKLASNAYFFLSIAYLPLQIIWPYVHKAVTI